MRHFQLVLALAVVASGVVVSTAAGLRFETGDCHEPSSGTVWGCPTGTTGIVYAAQLEGAGGCGPALPYQFRVLNGTLPPGTSLSSSGLISGRPTTPGRYEFWVELSDQDPPSASWCAPVKSERQFRIDIDRGLPPLAIETASVPTATVGTPYSTTLTATPAGTQRWALTGGTLPPGLGLDAATGVIAGTPTANGSFAFSVTVSDGANRSTGHEYRMDVRAPLAISLAPQGSAGGLPQSEVGIPLNGRLVATGGSEPFAWSVADGVLPAGVQLDADGSLVGTPRQAGRFAFTARVSDTEGRTATIEATVVISARLSIRTTRLRAAKPGRLYRAKIATNGGVGRTRWKLLDGRLPLGVRFAKKRGTLIGTPRHLPAGGSKRIRKYRFTLHVIDALGTSARRTLTLVVAKPRPGR